MPPQPSTSKSTTSSAPVPAPAPPAPPAHLPPIHRVVTGHDAQGRAIVASDGPLPHVAALAAIPGTVFHEVWATTASPAPVDDGPDPTLAPLSLPPPRGGTRIRFVDIPPDAQALGADAADRMAEAFTQIGDPHASTVRADSPHPLMHRTETVDYGVLIEGEIVLVLDAGEVTLRPGSVVVQRGTNHAWANRSGRTARMLFVLVDGACTPDLAHRLAHAEGGR